MPRLPFRSSTATHAEPLFRSPGGGAGRCDAGDDSIIPSRGAAFIEDAKPARRAVGSGATTGETPEQARAAPPRVRLACALLTALLWWLAGQRSGLFALGWVALAPMLWALHGLPARGRLRFGFLVGFLCYALINWWIAPTIVAASPVIGLSAGPGAALGVLAVVLIACIHGSLVALAAWCWNPTARHDEAPHSGWSPRLLAAPLLFAGVWAMLDAARCETALAHAWGALAYTQWRDTALLQSAALAGQHGLSFLCAWFAASLALWMRSGIALLWRVPVVVFALLHIWGAARLAQSPLAQSPLAHASSPRRAARGLRVLLVQTSVPSLRKNKAGSADDPFVQAFTLTRERARRDEFDLIVWPETTANLGPEVATPGETWQGQRTYGGPHMRAIAALCRELQTPILFGARRSSSVRPSLVRPLLVPAGSGSPEAREHFNEAVLVDAAGNAQGSAKQRLVPFGERAPYGEHLPFLRMFAPQPEVTPATTVQPLSLSAAREDGEGGDEAKSRDVERKTRETLIGTLICFESCFRYPARRLQGRGARAFFVLTNDEWAGGTSAPWEHAAMAAVRAVENDAPVAQAANGGYTFAVDRYGRFMVKSSFDVPQTLSVLLPLP